MKDHVVTLAMVMTANVKINSHILPRCIQPSHNNIVMT